MSDDNDRAEKRAGELLRAGEDAIDPALASRLQAFFGEPQPAPAARPKWVPPPGWELPELSPEEERERERRLQETFAAVQGPLLERIQRRGERSATMVSPPEPPAPVVDPSLVRFDLAGWRLGFAGEAREVQRADDLADALAESTPQAVLRDLHRPVFRFARRLVPQQLGSPEPPGAAAREAMRQDYRVRLEGLVDRGALAELKAGRRYWLRELPWAEARPETPTERPSAFPDANDLKWFGDIGYDPDQ